MAEQGHQSETTILGRRSLEQDHARLAEVLKAEMSVLDVGCGTGAITVGIARAVGSKGLVVGLDRDTGMVDLAREQHSGVANLRFEVGDILNLELEENFDVVAAARTLQWVSNPGLAVSAMTKSTRSGGLVVVLDYNHSQNRWEPEAPAEFHMFYAAFLKWRAQNGWDNEMGDHLPQMFQAAGLTDVTSQRADQLAERGMPDFNQQVELWPRVIDNIGQKLIEAECIEEEQLQSAKFSFEEFSQNTLKTQVLAMRSVLGRKT